MRQTFIDTNTATMHPPTEATFQLWT